MTIPLPPVPDSRITETTVMAPQWQAWFNQLYIYLTQTAGAGGGVANFNNTIGTSPPLQGGDKFINNPVISIENNGIDNGLLALMPANTIKGNDSNSIESPKDLTVSEVLTLLNLQPQLESAASQVLVATVNGQTVFTLAPDFSTLSVGVVTLDGAMLYPIIDYTVTGSLLTLNSPVNIGQSLYVLASTLLITQESPGLLPAAISNEVILSKIGASLKETAAELAAGITPVNYVYPIGNAARYGVDITGLTDSTAAMQTWINASWQTLVPGVPFIGSQGGNPIPTLPPARVRVSGTTVLPGFITLQGTAHPANTESHTRVIMNSTGITFGRTWSAGAVIPPFGNIQALVGSTLYNFSTASGGVTGLSTPAWASSGTTTDGTVVWNVNSVAAAGDNRNKAMFKFSRGQSFSTYPAGGTITNTGINMTIANLEFWYVTLGNDFNSPLSGAGFAYADYPLGATLYFDVDALDTYIHDCVFQASPCAINFHNCGSSSTTRGDGFTGNVGFFVVIENCEFDASAAHIIAQNSNLDLEFRNCRFFGSRHSYVGCTGRVVYTDCKFFGGAWVDASDASNSFTTFAVIGGHWEQTASVHNFVVAGTSIQANLMCYGAEIFDVKNVTFDTPSGIGTVFAYNCSGGSISSNSINNSGYNAPAGSGLTDFTAAIYLYGCQNMKVSDNNILATNTSGSYNGFGILTGSSGTKTSQKNFINGNMISAPYNGANFNGRNRQLNIASIADIAGINYLPSWPVGKLGPHAWTRSGVQYSASITIDASAANVFEISVFDGNSFTINNPINISEGQVFVLIILNVTAGSIGTMSFGNLFKVTTIPPPNAGGSVAIIFYYNGANIVEFVSGTGAVPN